MQLSANQKLIGSYFWNNKIRGHRRDSNDIIPDIASRRQTNPVQTTQAKYTGIRGSLVFESNFSVMDGQTNYLYQPETDPASVRIIDTGTTEVFNAQTREDASAELPSSVRQHVHVRQERPRRRASAQGRRAVGPAVLLVRTIRY